MMRMIKFIIKKLCPGCKTEHREVVFEGAEEDIDNIQGGERFYLSVVCNCCGKSFFPDCYELWINGILVTEGALEFAGI